MSPEFPGIESNPAQAEGSSPILTDIPRYTRTEPPPAPARKPAQVAPLNLVLFLVTLLTTTMAGAFQAGADISLWHPILSAPALARGLPFSIPLMSILLAHEMGHYLTARRNRVDVSLPYFIPAPFPSLFFIGTFGAFIRIRSMPRTRRAMFDIGAAGPWAGMLIALPVLIIGLATSKIVPLNPGAGGLEFGDSILLLQLERWVLHIDPHAVNVDLNPVGFAGWLGLFVTTLNLLPASQLDGGHVIYALLGRHHRIVSRLVFIAAILMVFVPLVLGLPFWWGWALWAVLLVLFGLGHPATADPDTPLDPMRRFAALATIGLFIVTFVPVPVSFNPPSGEEPAKTYNVMHVPAVPQPLPSGVKGWPHSFSSPPPEKITEGLRVHI